MRFESYTKTNPPSCTTAGMIDRRRLIRFFATGVCADPVSSSGCLGDGTTVENQNSSERVNPEIRHDRLSREEFDDYTSEMREVYGENGVGGRDGGAPDSLDFVGAWTRTSEIMNDSGRNDSAVAVYRTGRRTGVLGDEYVLYVFWLWNAARSELAG